MRNFLAAIAAALILSTPLAASAQDVPSYAQPGGGDDSQIRGRIASFDGGYDLQVRDDRGYVDNVQLHPGTIINPTGLQLAPGMIVSILGFNQGQSFAANEIDTPYAYQEGIPYYGGHPWNYYGPSISLGFFFGNSGWWHGDAFAGNRYHYNGGARVYNNVTIHNVYRGGNFQGHAYVAPAARGGYARGSFARGYASNAHPNGGGHTGGGHPAGGGSHGGGDHGGGDHHH